MSKLPFSLILMAAAATASAQNNQAPNPNPPIGGLIDPSLIQADPISNAKQAILQDTLKRQFTPQEIEKFRSFIDSLDRSKSGIYEEAAKVIRRRIQVGISPDSPVEEIRLNAENTGSIVFTDALGNPWNVADVLVPNYILATIVNNMIVFRPNSGQGQEARRFGNGSITVILEGLNSTIPFQLSYGHSRLIDGQIEAQVQARNPANNVSLLPSNPIEVDADSELFLDGEPPSSAKSIKTSHSSVKAWLYKDKLYVRTNLPIHTPSYILGASSASGASIFKFSPIPSIINAIVDGSVVSVSIGEF